MFENGGMEGERKIRRRWKREKRKEGVRDGRERPEEINKRKRRRGRKQKERCHVGTRKKEEERKGKGKRER